MIRGVVDRRSYGDSCGVARALDAVGERWALLVVRELLFGPKRYADLQNVLSQRLRELEQESIIRRRKLGPPASIRVYELTERGQALEPVLCALARWGSRSMLDPTAELSADALMLALKVTFDPTLAGDLRVGVELRFADDRFHAEIEAGRFQLARGAADRPDVVLDTDAATLRSVVFGGQPVPDVTGDRQAAARFVACFPRPTPFPD
jgi:DNA-binding HxlR family transcriptional regulator